MSDVVAPSFWQAALEFVFHDADGAPVAAKQVQHFSVGPDTPLEIAGSKLSQRQEMAETAQSDDANGAAPMTWYHWSIYIDPVTLNPSDTGDDAKLHLGQFHQRNGDGHSDIPALMFNLTSGGDLVAQFEQSVGKRAHVLVDGGLDGQAAKGHWIDVVVGAEWDHVSGWTEFHIRQEGEFGFRLAAQDLGPNTSTGSLYFKYGVYRSFLERDPGLADSLSSAYYRDVSRADSWDGLFQDLVHPAAQTQFGHIADPFGTSQSAPQSQLETDRGLSDPAEPIATPLAILDHFDFG